MMQAEREGGLAGLEVAITGKLACMSREEAVARIRRAGGRYVATPGERTSLLVVGLGGPPLGDDGQLTASLRRARALAAAGHAVDVVPETRLLEHLGIAERQAEIQRLYTTDQVARMLELPIATVRTWVRQRLLQPVKVVQRLHFFDFQQVASARALTELSERGVTPGRLRHSLQQLGALGGAAAHRALAQLEIVERGGPVLVRRDDGRLAETDGQLRLGFEDVGRPAAAPPASAAPAARSPPERAPGDAPRPAPGTTQVAGAAAWFEAGCQAEDQGRLLDALDAYAAAWEADPSLPEIAFNRGNVLYGLGRREESVEAYRDATALDTEYVEAWNNLGNVLGELDQLRRAAHAYERALAVAPEYADAHFNLAETLAALGNLPAARLHWQAYLAQDPGSTWADTVRRRLAETDGR